jgi:hypothetical protein
MKLIEAISKLASLDEADTSYASEPWAPDSEVVLAEQPESGGLPDEAKRHGLKYFLEVFIAREVLEGWLTNLDNEPTLEDTCARIIEYAINDA